MPNNQAVGLLGLQNSNRDFTRRSSWGKNQFNSSFPAALCCYMGENDIPLVYLTLDDNLAVSHGYLSAETLFGARNLLSEHLFFSFETVYSPYEGFIMGNCPSVDLVTLNTETARAQSLNPIEVKLTALPDNQTCELPENEYGTELVIRPQTIAYLALSIIEAYHPNREELRTILEPVCRPIVNWSDPAPVRERLPRFISALNTVLERKIEKQIPLLMQPIWKTRGKSPVLHEQCLDVFVWSNFALTRLFVDIATTTTYRNVTRAERTVVWTVKMLYDYAVNGQFDFTYIKDHITYNTGNDKAFAIGGRGTHPYMRCEELTTPRVSKDAFREIILGGGQNFLSPERRLDAIILNTPGLFEE